MVLIAALTKLAEGAWVVVVLVPLIVWRADGCTPTTSARARRSRRELTWRRSTRSASVAPPRLPTEASARLAEASDDPSEVHSFAVVPVAVLDLAALHALAYAASLAQPVLALHMSPTEEEAERFRRAWHAWGDHLPLEVVVSPVPRDGGAACELHRRAASPAPGRDVDAGRARDRGRQALAAAAAQPRRGTPARRPDRIRGIVITTVPFHLPG